MGYAFTFHVIHWLGQAKIPIGAYVHYPTISTEMLKRVKSRKAWHTNDGTISSSSTLSKVKLLYVRYHSMLSLCSASAPPDITAYLCITIAMHLDMHHF